MRLLRLPEVERLIGLKKSTLYALIERGDFPQQIKISARASAWSEDAIQSWIAERIKDAEELDARTARRDVRAAKKAINAFLDAERDLAATDEA